MDSSFKRKIAGAAAGVALLAGAGGAYAVTKAPDKNGRDAFLSNVAKRLNVSPAQLDAAFQGALSDRLDADVAAGRLTRKEADQIEKRMKEHGSVPVPGAGPPFGGPPPLAGPPPPGAGPRPFFERRGGHRGFGGPGPGGPPHGPGGPGGPLMAGLGAAAKYLDLTEAQLRTKLRAGKSLAQVAGDQSKSVDGLKSAIKDAVKSDLDKAVADKRITADQETRMLAELDEHLGDIVNGKPGDRPRPPRPGRGARRHP
jgi:hypothetical protein